MEISENFLAPENFISFCIWKLKARANLYRERYIEKRKWEINNLTEAEEEVS